MDIKDFVTAGNFVIFDSFRAGIFYYNIPHKTTLQLYQFQVPIEDTGGATLKCRDKSIMFMRWIRKSIEDKTFIKIL
jgi:hypothetical protein